jgi:hypothetical protein
MRGWAINPLMGPASHTNDVSCSDTPKLSKKGVPYLPTRFISPPMIQRRIENRKGRKVNAAKHIPELNCPSDLGTRHRDAQEYQILGRQPLCGRVHESLDACGGGVQPQRSSFDLRGFDSTRRVVRLEDVRARGVSTTGWPGHLGCRVGVSVRVGSKSHGRARLTAVSVGVCVSALCGGVEWSEGKVSLEAYES